MNPDPGSVERISDFGDSPGAVARRWQTEISLAKKDRNAWTKDVKKITKRYRDTRNEKAKGSKFNILWSNVQTLGPAIYAQAPKPVVERRVLDRDPVARTACLILERTLTYQIDVGYFHRTLKLCRDDYLLAAQGVDWLRYEPIYGEAEAEDKLTDTDTDADEQPDAGPEAAEGYDAASVGIAAPAAPQAEGPEEDEAAEPEQEPFEPVVSEKVCVDYVHWSDFLCSPARVEDEITWKARRSFLTRDQLGRRFGGGKGWNKSKAKAGRGGLSREQIMSIPLDHRPAGMSDQESGRPENELLLKATVWEIWDKSDKQVIFLAEQWGEMPLEVAPDPLKLEGFWPTPAALLGTTTTDTVVPVPDYIQYKDQAEELDELTTRIELIISAIRVAGCYDAAAPMLARLLDENAENKLYPVDSWAAFAEKGGILGAISWMPIKEMAEVLTTLYQARQQVKADLYEITGISDIVRGFSEAGAPKTATEQRIKGQFANLRLTDRQGEMARFARDTLGIMGELIAEHFSPETLYEMSGFEQWGFEEHLPPEPEPEPEAPQGPPPPPPMGHNGGPPMQDGAPPIGSAQVQNGVVPVPIPPPGGQPPAAAGPMPTPAMMAPAPPPPDPMVIAKAKAKAQFDAAVKLLKDEKLRGFRIDIETDSTIAPDQDAEKQSRVEFLTATGQFLTSALPIAQAEPKMLPLLGKLLLFGVRGFKAGRELEAAFEETVDRLEQQAAQPQQPPPNPEQQKTEAVAQQEQIKVQSAQKQAEIAAQALAAKQQADAMSVAQQKELQDQKAAQDAQARQADHDAKMAQLERQQRAEAEAHNRSIEKANNDAMNEAARAKIAAQQEEDKAALADAARRAEFEHKRVMYAQEQEHTAARHKLEREHLAVKAHHEKEMIKVKAKTAKKSDGASA